MPRARYKQLVDQFADRIRSGALPPGTQLPTHRQLASDEGIALVTASRVYTELEAMGLVSGETGRGTFVRETALPPGHGIDQPVSKDGMLDLNFNSPSIPEQTDLLRHALRQLASSGDLDALLHYQPHAGRMHERVSFARHLKARGLTVKPDNLLVVSGAQHGLATSVMAMLKPGDVVAVDALIYPGFKAVAEAQHLELTPIPCSENGSDLEALAHLCNARSVRAIYTMPTLHNPLGYVMPMEQREKLVAIAREHNLIIIEDAAYAFHAEDPPPPIAALAPERTLYVSGLSKSIATGLRVGFVVSPEAWVSKVERSIRATTWNTPGLMTALACKWVDDGTVDKLEEQKRKDAQTRQAMANRIFEGMPYVSHSAAYFMWLPLPEEVRADKIVMELIEANISVSTAEPFATTEHVPHALRLALGSVDMGSLEVALRKVRDVIDGYAY